MGELALYAEVTIEVVGAAHDISARVLLGKAEAADATARPKIRITAKDVEARGRRWLRFIYLGRGK